MNADAVQEDGLAVQQYLLTLGLDGAEAHLVFQRLAVQRHLHVVELRILWAPQL